jgi:dolichyl-phosphate beta-glucosyltransferase
MEPLPEADVNPPFLSIIIPTFNERNRIEATLDKIVSYLRSRSYSWEVNVADDGSTDETTALVKMKAKGDPRIVLTQGRHGGKGSALKTGMSQAKGEYIFLCDADLSMPIQQLERFLPPFLSDYDIAVGSREVPGARRVEEPQFRHFQGRVFNAIIKIMGLTEYQDTQCGFKCIRAEVLRPLLPLLRINGFSFDVELLFLAKKNHLRVAEVPIDWLYKQDSKVRFLTDSWKMLAELIAIRLNFLMGRYQRP